VVSTRGPHCNGLENHDQPGRLHDERSRQEPRNIAGGICDVKKTGLAESY
jgi:hypothetical protein